MTVADLIAKLKTFDPTSLVVVRSFDGTVLPACFVKLSAGEGQVLKTLTGELSGPVVSVA